jgi:hypothetical protein
LAHGPATLASIATLEDSLADLESTYHGLLVAKAGWMMTKSCPGMAEWAQSELCFDLLGGDAVEFKELG